MFSIHAEGDVRQGRIEWFDPRYKQKFLRMWNTDQHENLHTIQAAVPVLAKLYNRKSREMFDELSKAVTKGNFN